MSTTSVGQRFIELEKRRIFHSMKSYLWTLSGFFGNIFFKRMPPDTVSDGGRRLLNLGCGARKFKGWVNADYYRLQNLFWKRNQLPDWMIDLTLPLKCDSEYWDGVLFEHVNEHLLYSDNHTILKEVHRVLKPGGVCRIIVPDLDKYLQWNELKLVERKMARYGSQAEAISNLTQNHLHLSVWNHALMKELLLDVGFDQVELSDFHSSSIPEMNVGSPNHRWESLYVEAKKSK